MQKIKLLKSLLIPTLGISVIGSIAAVSTSCESKKKNVKITANEDSTLELKNEGGNSPILQYSTDEKNWQNYEESIIIPKGTSYYFKGWNLNGWSQSDIAYSTLFITGNVSISGNIIGLLDNGKGSLPQVSSNYCFYNLFQGSTGITSVSEDFLLIKNLLGQGCYAGMFQGCTSLTTAPDLPATSLPQFCYGSMFQGCTSLTKAPDLPATYLTMSCYYEMFQGCTSLTTAPNLSAIKLAGYCYFSMFDDCSSLTIVPDLPATTLADYCYSYMFNGCTSLTTTPNLPATSLATGCYYGMFTGCTSLTTAPDLPATTLEENCYRGMFADCTKLGSIKINYIGNVQDAPKNAFSLWVNNVATTGVFYYKGNDTLVNFEFPSNWTINRDWN